MEENGSVTSGGGSNWADVDTGERKKERTAATKAEQPSRETEPIQKSALLIISRLQRLLIDVDLSVSVFCISDTPLDYKRIFRKTRARRLISDALTDIHNAHRGIIPFATSSGMFRAWIWLIVLKRA